MNNQTDNQPSNTSDTLHSTAGDDRYTGKLVQIGKKIAALLLIYDFSRKPLFSLGRVVATPGALDLLDRSATDAESLLYKHQRGEFGDICADDASDNRYAIEHGNRINSAYKLGPQQETLWVITEACRTCTVLLLPTEY